MQITVRKDRQFPDGKIDLRGLPGKETIFVDARLGQEIWIHGNSEGEPKIFGHFKIQVGQGPFGFGLVISTGVGDVPITLNTDKGKFQTEHLQVSELIPEPTGVKEWRPPR